jgi:hypothetical protein
LFQLLGVFAAAPRPRCPESGGNLLFLLRLLFHKFHLLAGKFKVLAYSGGLGKALPIHVGADLRAVLCHAL